MNQKTFYIVRIVFAIIIATVCSISVVRGNYILPIIIAITAAFVLYAIKKRVSGVLADERDYKIAGDAARWSLSIYAIFASVASMVLMVGRNSNFQFGLAAQILAYSACALLIMQSLFFEYFRGKK